MTPCGMLIEKMARDVRIDEQALWIIGRDGAQPVGQVGVERQQLGPIRCVCLGPVRSSVKLAHQRLEAGKQASVPHGPSIRPVLHQPNVAGAAAIARTQPDPISIDKAHLDREVDALAIRACMLFLEPCANGHERGARVLEWHSILGCVLLAQAVKVEYAGRVVDTLSLIHISEPTRPY